jgi:hypothetical protein
LQAMTQPAPALRAVAPHASAPMARLIDTALAFEAQHRFPDARAMRVAVWQACAAFDSDPDPALLPLDASIEQAAVLLPEDESSGAASSSKPTTTYRPVTRSNGPSSARPPGSTARAGKRFTIALALGVMLATASAVVLVGLPDRSASTALLGKASLSIHDAALAAGTRSLTSPEPAEPPARAETIEAAPPTVGPLPRTVRKTPRRPARKSAAQPSKAADLDSASATTSVPTSAPATETRTPAVPRDPLGRRK